MATTTRTMKTITRTLTTTQSALAIITTTRREVPNETADVNKDITFKDKTKGMDKLVGDDSVDNEDNEDNNLEDDKDGKDKNADMREVRQNSNSVHISPLNCSADSTICCFMFYFGQISFSHPNPSFWQIFPDNVSSA